MSHFDKEVIEMIQAEGEDTREDVLEHTIALWKTIAPFAGYLTYPRVTAFHTITTLSLPGTCLAVTSNMQFNTNPDGTKGSPAGIKTRYYHADHIVPKDVFFRLLMWEGDKE